MEKYYDLDFDKQVIQADIIISELNIKYIDSKVKMKDRKSLEQAKEFSKKMMFVSRALSNFHFVFARAEYDCNKLLNENTRLKRIIAEYNKDEIDLVPNDEWVKNLKENLAEKYQKQIQELEQKNDKLMQELVKKINNTKL